MFVELNEKIVSEQLLEMQNHTVYPQNDSTYSMDYTGIYLQQQHAYNEHVQLITNLL